MDSRFRGNDQFGVIPAGSAACPHTRLPAVFLAGWREFFGEEKTVAKIKI